MRDSVRTKLLTFRFLLRNEFAGWRGVSRHKRRWRITRLILITIFHTVLVCEGVKIHFLLRWDFLSKVDAWSPDCEHSSSDSVPNRDPIRFRLGGEIALRRIEGVTRWRTRVRGMSTGLFAMCNGRFRLFNGLVRILGVSWRFLLRTLSRWGCETVLSLRLMIDEAYWLLFLDDVHVAWRLWNLTWTGDPLQWAMAPTPTNLATTHVMYFFYLMVTTTIWNIIGYLIPRQITYHLWFFA